MNPYILAIDQGTSSSRAMVFNYSGQCIGQHQVELQSHFPQPAWVEQDAEAIWQTVLSCCRQALADAELTATQISAVGISNQRESTILWDRSNGQAVHPLLVWQDRRTADYCRQLGEQATVAAMVNAKTGLLLDPYFSGSKIHWLLEHVPGVRQRAERGELAFGTVDSYLLWRLTAGNVHKTDASNAARTLLFNIHHQQWDPELLQLFDIPAALLPEVEDNSADFGCVDAQWLGAEIPITGMAGDQQAATVGQVCFKPGMVKSTYGTGCFMLLNTGQQAVTSQHRLLTTVAYRLQGQVTYALEGSIFVAGAAMQWLRDALNIIERASESQQLALEVADNAGVYLVPAFTGLGAPYWDPDARGALLGLTRDTGVAHIVRAALEAVCYQSYDLLQAMQQDYGETITSLRVDGGMAANDWLLQFLTDVLNVVVERPQLIETSALGAAYLAGLGAGIYQSLDEISALWSSQQHFQPNMKADKRKQLLQGWHSAVQRILSE